MAIALALHVMTSVACACGPSIRFGAAMRIVDSLDMLDGELVVSRTKFDLTVLHSASAR
jgi:hypothetical protein